MSIMDLAMRNRCSAPGSAHRGQECPAITRCLTVALSHRRVEGCHGKVGREDVIDWCL